MDTSIRASGTARSRARRADASRWAGGGQGSTREWQRVLRRLGHSRRGLAGVAIVLALGTVALAADAFAPYSPYAIDSTLRGASPSGAHLLGVDQVGRDELSRLIHGARVSMLVGVLATSLAVVVGTAVGLLAGSGRGWLDAILMRSVDGLQSVPILVLLIASAAVLGPSLQSAIAIIGLTGWTLFARLVRADVMSLREREFVLAARATGASNSRILLGHVLPNVLGPVVVLASQSIPSVILLESALSFLGLGAQPPTAAWGSMVADGRTYLLTYPHIALFPGMAITLAVLGFNLLGDGLRDALDPRIR